MENISEMVEEECRTDVSKHSVSRGEGKKKICNFNVLKIGLDLPRPTLYERINNRVDEMIRNGLLNEAEKLFPFRNLNALQTVGYEELFDFFENKISLEKAIELIRRNTRRFAKRQMTWFRKDKEIHWFHPEEKDRILSFILHSVHQWFSQ